MSVQGSLEQRKVSGKIEQVFRFDPRRGPSAVLSLESMRSQKKPSSMMGEERHGTSNIVFSDYKNNLGTLSTFCEVQRNVKMQCEMGPS